jgi:hypothetical protein
MEILKDALRVLKKNNTQRNLLAYLASINSSRKSLRKVTIELRILGQLNLKPV